ncbi:hypothetical protein B5F77_12605 [Parabacteroides sp. An277]|uniref:DUF3244 domain-containing protein n=1 Tax=Parabacteroides sp. An277 TaxID=1965619 RepID=UPI000B3B0024|nr:DUF3244 domain-containing protein [Parabacteroides sp. An277]OUO50527.1 hypothetical protein B5F77_12605 [Parabacteroides sp. An277]
MKVKFFQALAVAIALLIAFPAFAAKKIMWDGFWKKPSKPRSIEIPIIGNIDETTETLTLDFQSDLGDVVVSITDASGNVVYQESVQTDVTPSVTISLEGLDANGGTVSVTDGENLIYGLINL